MTKRKNRTYTEDFKKDAMNLALKAPTIKSAAESLGIPEGTLATWLRESTTKIKDSSNVIDIQEELKKLRKENARLREEKEILKKAATYFTRDSE